MLFIDKLQVTAEEVAEMFNIPLAKIRKAPEFVLNPKKIIKRKAGQSKEISFPSGASVPALIFVNLKGKKVELRYADAVNEVLKGEKYVNEYSPRKIEFKGLGTVIREDNEDLMVFMYLHPSNSQSPVRPVNAREVAKWMFKDVDQEGEDEMAEVKALQAAYATITSYTGEPLRIAAKAFDVYGVDSMNDASIQAQLVKVARNMALGGPVEFNKKMNSNTTVFRGLIANGMDRGMFVIKESNGRKRWQWGTTDRKGTDIVDVYENGVTERDTLIDYILTQITEYYPLLMKAQDAFVAEKTSDDFLSTQPKIDLNAMFNKPASAPIGGSTDEYSDDDDDDIDEENVDINEDTDLEPSAPEAEDDGIPSFLTGPGLNTPPAAPAPAPARRGNPNNFKKKGTAK